MKKILSVFLLLIVSFGFVPLSAAQGQTGQPVTWQGDIQGTPAWITVVPRGRTIPPEALTQKGWWEWGNTTTDTYMFSFGRRENVHIILAFDEQPDGTVEARIHLNNRGRRPIEHELVGDRVNVKSNDGHPYLTVRSEGGGWLVDGKANYNLRIAVDGPYGSINDRLTATDGVTDVEVRVGAEAPGVPGWQTVQLVFDPNPKAGFGRLFATKRMPEAPPFNVAEPLMPGFPYFDIGNGTIDGRPRGGVKNDINWFEQNPQPLYFSTVAPELLMLPFPGFQTGGMYYANSISAPPKVNFESPFAFYNYDPSTRQAHLVVRAESFPEGDRFGPLTKRQIPFERASYRYSWKTDNDGRWAYSLHMAGPFALDQTIKIGDVELNGIPHEQLPGWVAEKPWPVVTFIEATEGYPGSEGIYFYSAQSNDTWPFLDGTRERQPEYLETPYLAQSQSRTAASFVELPVGFRGEYNAAGTEAPTLYFSPIDNRMHLLNAQGGVWYLGEDVVMRVHNLDGDKYINGWTRERIPAQAPPSQDAQAATPTPAPDQSYYAGKTDLPKALPGEIEEAFYALGDHLIYSGPQGSEMRQVTFNPATFETPPPTDKASWEAFRERRQALKGQERNPANMRSWLDAFPGTTVLKSSGRISDVRAVGAGFRFVVDYRGGETNQEIAALSGQPLADGAYVVSYNGTFKVEPLTPANLSASVSLPQGAAPDDSKPTPLRVEVRNAGRQDAKNVTIIAEARQGRNTVEIGRRTFDAPAEQTRQMTFSWQPTAPGQWDINVRLEDAQAAEILNVTQSTQAIRSSAGDLPVLLSLSSGSLQRLPVLLGLLAFAICAALIVRIKRSSDDTETTV
jgi:hypothetical protein